MNVCSEVTGSIWKIRVAPGDQVDSGQELLVMESMKMEIPLFSPIGGTVAEVRVSEGDAVSEGEVLVVIEQ
jgi:acetyl-CoA carboxylase biotin carboxyl carrier protein